MNTMQDYPKGVLRGKAAEHKFTLNRYRPGEDTGFFVERYWAISWDLRGEEPHLQNKLPYPCVNLVDNSQHPSY
ncbi:DUF6597 domain-containing transcriptional factor [Paenibacillus sp. OSY-SE]|uniref:DUF6597 domain-containing transcriptional factor n=1 Tax=Paenibacillus sp. OSY-SE TaxID=1196323 RepID=UPI0012FADCC5|nr:DUF6597 domain-containing transcriptional factor [Paenibacillus sp. OSY-SE]